MSAAAFLLNISAREEIGGYLGIALETVSLRPLSRFRRAKASLGFRASAQP
ncbi:hypothetical protein ACU4GD_15905 [Cupriavidus basilensis]